jgi:hypothetical protein
VINFLVQQDTATASRKRLLIGTTVLLLLALLSLISTLFSLYEAQRKYEVSLKATVETKAKRDALAAVIPVSQSTSESASIDWGQLFSAFEKPVIAGVFVDRFTVNSTTGEAEFVITAASITLLYAWIAELETTKSFRVLLSSQRGAVLTGEPAVTITGLVKFPSETSGSDVKR